MRTILANTTAIAWRNQETRWIRL